MDIPIQTDRFQISQKVLVNFWLEKFGAPAGLPLCTMILLVACIATPAFANSPTSTKIQDKTSDQSPERIKQLIIRLGDSDHLVRTKSQEQLLKIGEPAVGPLQAVLNFEDSSIAPDNEIRLRATRLLILIQREVRERKLAEFLDGTRDGIELHGWIDFRNLLGNEEQARRLFIKLHEARSDLLRAPLDGKLKTENELHQSIVSEIRLSTNGNAESVVDKLSAVLFAASRKTHWDTDKLASAPSVIASDTKRIHRVLMQPHMIKTINGHSTGAEIKILISHWIDSLQVQSGDTKQSKLAKNYATSISVIDAYQIGDKSELVLKYALDTKLSSHTRSLALATLSRIGTTETIPKLAPLLSDSTVVGTYVLTGPFQASATSKPGSVNKASARSDIRPLLEVQIRDLALAASTILKGSSPDQFGFHPQAMSEGKLVVNQTGFLTDADRGEAIIRWNKHLQQLLEKKK